MKTLIIQIKRIRTIKTRVTDCDDDGDEEEGEDEDDDDDDDDDDDNNNNNNNNIYYLTGCQNIKAWDDTPCQIFEYRKSK